MIAGLALFMFGSGPIKGFAVALVIGNSADDACPPSHNQRLYNSITHERRKLHIVKGANHYYFGQQEELAEAVNVSLDWLKEEDLI